MKIKSYLNVLFLAGICMMSAMNVSAQSEKKSAVQISFFPPMSTHGTDAAQYTNVFSFNILAGVSKNETAFTFGSLANIIGNNSNGLQFAGLYNGVGNEGRGILFSGLLNMVGNSYRGLQFAGLSNMTNRMNGMQFAGLTNLAGDVNGFQFAGLLNAAKNVSGAQFVGLANAAGDVSGFQFAGLMNIAKNVSSVQFAGLINIAKNVSGLQFAGLINIAKSVSGLQFAGLINVAESSNCPVGLINLIRNGEKSVSLTYSEIGSTIVAFRSGGKYTYGIVGLGYNFKTKGKAMVSTGGLGAHINCTPWLRINNELSCETVGSFSNSKTTTFRTGYALMPAFKAGKRFEIFAGPTVNYLQTDDLNNANMFPGNSLWEDWSVSKLQQVYIGYQFGVQFIL
ncbi:MAG: hypothetical protein LBK97_00745 [Prevotellaceae bacterium]|jgi:hypothetical protein|nr:hypothetical protein [Prevotellaceae bacterium]